MAVNSDLKRDESLHEVGREVGCRTSSLSTCPEHLQGRETLSKAEMGELVFNRYSFSSVFNRYSFNRTLFRNRVSVGEDEKLFIGG